jgi:hypothetical protein
MTALQELIKQCNDAKNYIDGVMTDYEAGQKVAYEAVIDMATELIEKERQQIIDAWLDGGKSVFGAKNATQYYNTNFKD